MAKGVDLQKKIALFHLLVKISAEGVEPRISFIWSLLGLAALEPNDISKTSNFYFWGHFPRSVFVITLEVGPVN